MLKLIIAASTLMMPTVLLAHPHSIERNGRVLANGANHPAFAWIGDDFMSCETNALPPDYGEAWYGLETAHHGPDASGRGRGDGCYQIDGNLSPLNPASDRNPAIK